MDTTREQTQETLPEAISALGLSIKAEFVPWSQSRDYEKDKPVGKRMTQWRVTLLRDGKPVITTDYGQGIGHLPAYKASVKELGNRDCIMRMDAVERELETGRTWRKCNLGTLSKGAIQPPEAADVIASLVMDSEVLDAASFEDWADESGYDPDSRKAEKIYQACMVIALRLRGGLGDAGLRRLADAAREW